MSEVVIRAENVYKEYNLGTIGYGTLYQDLQSWWARVRGKEDPNAPMSLSGKKDYKHGKFYALSDVSFDINRGDLVGIIGRNGAGKSTLLKILSRITTPTKGQIKVKGRIASLLEVGTGFHAELTGRENIYLNGTILGMKKREIDRKLDEIVAFAGIEEFIDTPVKRYSSGMYVRLAFSVAAHLDSDILILDEVLAVGDTEFQNKCLGKMDDVAKNQGRTVLFVSHNMGAVKNLCNVGFLLNEGKIIYKGGISDIIDEYNKLNTVFSKICLSDRKDRSGSQILKFTSINLKNDNDDIIEYIDCGSSFILEINYELRKDKVININNFRLDIGIDNFLGNRVAWISADNVVGVDYKSKIVENDKIQFIIDKCPLVPGDYQITLYCQINNEVSDWIKNSFHLVIMNCDYYKTGSGSLVKQGDVLLNYAIKI